MKVKVEDGRWKMIHGRWDWMRCSPLLWRKRKNSSHERVGKLSSESDF